MMFSLFSELQHIFLPTCTMHQPRGGTSGTWKQHWDWRLKVSWNRFVAVRICKPVTEFRNHVRCCRLFSDGDAHLLLIQCILQLSKPLVCLVLPSTSQGVAQQHYGTRRLYVSTKLWDSRLLQQATLSNQSTRSLSFKIEPLTAINIVLFLYFQLPAHMQHKRGL